MSNLQLIQPKRVQTIIDKFCFMIGMIPSSYKMALTYEEQILSIGKYLEETVYPAINNNAEAVAQLQELFIDLKNYFDNLDVQEEINNKIDSMIEDGSFQDILNNSLFNNTTIVMGDSYAKGYQPGYVYIDGWCHYFKNALNLPDNEFFKFAEGGIGFVHQGEEGHTNFLNLLQSNIENIPDKTKIKNIVVCGGCNDANFAYNVIYQNITDFINYCKQTFKNAKIFIGMIGNFSYSNNPSIKLNMANNVLLAYQNGSVYNGANYLNGVENIMKDYNLFVDDNIHPNSSGYRDLGVYIAQSFIQGNCDFNRTVQPFSFVDENIDTDRTTLKGYSSIHNNIVKILLTKGKIVYNTPVSLTNDNDIAYLKNVKFRNYRPCNYFMTQGNTSVIFKTSENKYYSGTASIIITDNSELFMRCPIINNNDGSLIYGLSNITEITFMDLNITVPTMYA